MILKGYIFGIGYAILCMLLAAILYKLGVPKAFTRKIVHILVGAEWFILYHFFGAGVHFLAVCVLFLIVLSVAYRTNLLKMISSDESNSPGTVYYALAMSVVALVGCFVPEVMLPFGVGVLCTSLGDGLAGTVGQLFGRYNLKLYKQKTLVGCLVNFIASSASALLIFKLYSVDISLWYCLAIGLLSAELEMVTGYGLDNVSVTWGITAFVYLLMNVDRPYEYLAPILLSLIIFALASEKNALTRSGLAAAIVVDIVVSVAFKNLGFVVLSAFFVGAIIIDKIKKRAIKQGRAIKEAKGSKRDAVQVFVNSTASCVAAIAFLITKNPLFIVTFTACLAEAFADTAASGIGAFSDKAYDVFRLKKCDRGLSGGMSLIGTSTSLLAAFVIAVIPFLFGASLYGPLEVIIVALSAFLGMIVDSMLGSLLQVKYKCAKCGEITERKLCCGREAARYSGFEAIDNDIVNLISSSFSAVLATLLLLLF